MLSRVLVSMMLISILCTGTSWADNYTNDGGVSQVSLSDLQKLFPLTSFPSDAGPDDAWLSSQGYSRYTPPPPTLASKQEAAWAAIKAERDRRVQSGGYKVGDKWFHSDIVSRTQQIGLVLNNASIPAGLQWKTMDGSFVTMTAALAQQVLNAAMASDSAIFAYAETLRSQMMLAADPATFNILSGWPLAYGG